MQGPTACLSNCPQSIVNDWPSVWPTAGQIASPSPMQANGIKQNTPVSLHSAVVAGNGSKRRIQLHRISGYSVGHGICMHMGMDNDRWVFEMVKSSLVIFLKKKNIYILDENAYLLSLRKSTTQSRQNRMPLHLNAQVHQAKASRYEWHLMWKKWYAKACNVLICKECSSQGRTVSIKWISICLQIGTEMSSHACRDCSVVI